VTQFVYPVALVSAAMIRKVTWRQATYHIDGPWNIRRVEDVPYEGVGAPANPRASL
jgi:hypothetical protein